MSVSDTNSVPPQMGFVLAMLVLGVSASQSRTKHSPGSNIGRWSWGFCFLDVALNFASLAVAFGVSVRNGHFEPHNCHLSRTIVLIEGMGYVVGASY